MQVELLAPAGNIESLKAAFVNGADAVYLGGVSFSARRQAANFNMQELLSARKMADSYNAKLYITMNTVVSDEEMEEAAIFIDFLANNGFDAIIIQDIGLLKLIKEIAPSMPIHASTQMTIHNIDGAKMMQDFGLDRVILARELTLPEITAISDLSSISTEIFVHGALCICYSGRCLFSSMIGGRSGNRGMCAQPCRMKYSLTNIDNNKRVSREGLGEYLLSPKDLCTLQILPDIIASGVSSLKIEGRMKRPEYVATTVRIYRKELDNILNKQKNENIDNDIRELGQIFNRGFSFGYLKEQKNTELISDGRPNNRGMYLGRIVSYDAKSLIATIRLDGKLNVGDGIEVWVSQGGRCGTKVEQMNILDKNVDLGNSGDIIQIKIQGKIFPGDRVFKTSDIELINSSRVNISEIGVSKVPVEARLTLNNGFLNIELTDMENGFKANTTGTVNICSDNEYIADLDVIKEKVARLGNTPFFLKDLIYEIHKSYKLPMSEINSVRRSAADALLEMLSHKEKSNENRLLHIVNNMIISRKKTTSTIKEKRNIISIRSNIPEILVAAEKKGVSELVIGEDLFWSNELSSLVSSLKNNGKKVIIAVPSISRNSREETQERMSKIIDIKPDALMAGDYGGIRMCMDSGYPYFVDYFLPIFNSVAISSLSELGCSGVTLSPELTLNQISNLSFPVGMEIGCLVHGRLQLMISEYCPLRHASGSKTCFAGNGICKKNDYILQDEKGYGFPVFTDRFCRMHLLNSKEICMADKISEMKNSGIRKFVLDFSYSKEENAREIIDLYKKSINNDSVKLSPEDLKTYYPNGFTRGHYYRGVQ